MLHVNSEVNPNLIANQKRIKYTSTESTKEILETHNIMIDFKLIKNFNLAMSLVYLSIAVFTLFPQLIIKHVFDKINQAIVMQAFWWLIIPVLLIFLLVCVFTYLNKKLLIREDASYLSIILFSFYLISLLFLFSIGSLFSFELFVGLSCTLITCFGLLSFLNLFRIFDDKRWIKMICLCSLSFVALIIYLIFVQKRIVEFFVMLMITLMIYYYIVNNTTLMLVEYIKVYGLIFNEDGVQLRWCLFTAIVTNVEFIAVCFK